MGWTFYKQPGNSKQAQLKYLLKELNASSNGDEYDRHILYHCQRGSVLWQVVALRRKSDDEVFRFINCTLLEYDKDSSSWGWKSMDEGMGPCYYNCPLGYLDKAPTDLLPEEIAKSPYAQSWRDSVRLYHRKYRIGDHLVLREGYKIPELTVVDLKPLTGIYRGHLYRVPRSGIARVIPGKTHQAA